MFSPQPNTAIPTRKRDHASIGNLNHPHTGMIIFELYRQCSGRRSTAPRRCGDVNTTINPATGSNLNIHLQQSPWRYSCRSSRPVSIVETLEIEPRNGPKYGGRSAVLAFTRLDRGTIPFWRIPSRAQRHRRGKSSTTIHNGSILPVCRVCRKQKNT